jgi:hypothetical protein
MRDSPKSEDDAIRAAHLSLILGQAKISALARLLTRA